MGELFDEQYHHLTFALDENKTLIVHLDGVKIEGSDKELAMKVFEHGIWFKYQPLPSVVEPKKGRNRKR